MEDTKTLELLRRSREEILRLRRINNDLAAKADAYEQLRAVLNLIPSGAQGFEEDFAWRLQKEIEEIEAAQANPDHEKAEA